MNDYNRTDWTEIGKDYDRETVLNNIALLEWNPLPMESIPMMPAMGIEECIKELRLPKVSHIAWNGAIGPCGLYGIRTHYKNADVDVFIIDEGTRCFPVCMGVNPK